MRGGYCTPIDSGGIWCQAGLTIGDQALTGPGMVLAYSVILLITWTLLAAGSRP
jgi:hypothetical protein